MAITFDSIKANWLNIIQNKYFNFEGRASRSEYWLFTLVNFIFAIVLAIVDSIIGMQILGSLFALAVLLPGLGVMARRLHDTNRSGWWILISLVPLVGIIVLIVFLVMDSDPNANRFGPNPKA